MSVLRKIQAGTSALMITEEAMLSEAIHQSSVENDDSHGNDAAYQTDDASVVALTAPPSTLSPAALHILQHLETSGFDGTPAEEPDMIHSLIDQLPLSNFMTEVEYVGDVLTTLFKSHDRDVKSITMNVCRTFEQMLNPHWDSCASACFESSLDSCAPNSFVELVKKVVSTDGACNSDGMAWRRYHPYY